MELVVLAPPLAVAATFCRRLRLINCWGGYTVAVLTQGTQINVFRKSGSMFEFSVNHPMMGEGQTMTMGDTLDAASAVAVAVVGLLFIDLIKRARLDNNRLSPK